MIPTCFRVFDVGLRSPGPRLDVAPLLEGKDEAAVADDRPLGQPLQETFSRHDEYLVVTSCCQM